MSPCQGECREFEPRLPLHFDHLKKQSSSKNFASLFMLYAAGKGKKAATKTDLRLAQISYECAKQAAHERENGL